MYNLGLGLILGLVLGSFIKCLADRSLTNESFWGRSYCTQCHHELHWYDLFPILSYLSTGGHCRYCHHQIGPSYPLTEALMAILTGLLFWWQFPAELTLFASCAFLIKLVLVGLSLAILITDLETGLIPDRLTYPAFWLVLALVIIQFIISLVDPIQNSMLANSLLSALGLGLFFGSIIFLTKGQGMGGGDLKLGVVMGLGLGFPDALIALMLAFLSGSIIGVGLIAFGKKSLKQTIPFGPFLSFGTIVTIYWGPQILNWYLNLRFA